jgi:tripartite-type tricarboxylate transporter receptor subunit TctC
MRASALLLCSMVVAMFVTFAGSASAQYPQRPVRVIVPNPPGGATDTVARLFAPKMSEALGQPVLVDNRSGSNGNLATEMVGKAAPDGYTLLLAADAQIVISPHIYAMSVDPIKDLVPFSSLVTTQLMLVAGASLPVKNLQEFIEYARRAKPSLAYASIGNGSQHQLAMEMLKAKAGIDMVHVPYKGGGPAMVALLAGDVAAMFGGNSVSGQVKAGKVRALAAAGGKRIAAYPDMPTLGEVYAGVEVTPWLGMFAPAGTPAAVLTRVRGEANRLLADPEMRDRVAKGGLEPWSTTAEEFAAVVRADYVKYGDVVKSVGVKVE